MSWAFLLTSLVIVATPGTGALYTLAAGLTRGTRASILAAFACTLGTVPHLLAAVTGLAALLHASGVAFQTIKYAGVAYLLYMAWATWRDKGALAVDKEDTQPASWRSVIVAGVTLNLLNPKLTIFFFAFLPVVEEVALATVSKPPEMSPRPSCLPGLVVLVCQECWRGAASGAPASDPEGGPGWRRRHRGGRWSRARVARLRSRWRSGWTERAGPGRRWRRRDQRARGAARRPGAGTTSRRRPVGEPTACPRRRTRCSR